MPADRHFLDTAYVQALLNRADQYHAAAVALAARVRTAGQVWITEAVLIEIANALSAINRAGAVAFIEQVYRTPNIKVVTVDTSLLQRALAFYKSRADKAWGLTDCISFTVMKDQGLSDAATADSHFVQAGFRAMLR